MEPNIGILSVAICYSMCMESFIINWSYYIESKYHESYYRNSLNLLYSSFHLSSRYISDCIFCEKWSEWDSVFFEIWLNTFFEFVFWDHTILIECSVILCSDVDNILLHIGGALRSSKAIIWKLAFLSNISLHFC